MNAIRCVVVDDSALSRKIVRSALERIANVEVIAIAHDGLDGVERCKSLQPDFVTMDLEMPRMNGIEAVREIRRLSSNSQIVMVSSLTSAGANITTEALRAGAFDFVLKPVSSNVEESIAKLSSQLAEKINAVREHRAFRRSSPAAAPKSTPTPARGSWSNVAAARAPQPPVKRSTKRRPAIGEIQALFIGVSTGGPVALGQVIPKLPGNLPVPVFIVQHMPPVFTKSLAEQLDRSSNLTVVEGADGMKAEPGTVYIAPGGRHMKVDSTMGNYSIRITDDPPVSNARPSVDYLFQSAARTFGRNQLAVILTGMGSDGTVGCRQIDQAGGYIITQNAETCVVYGMPRSVNEAGLADETLPLDDIAGAITKLIGEGAMACR